jgi:predicted anti-sigma-YlaC factor YlaD
VSNKQENKKMNCKETKIWITEASDEKLYAPSEEVLKHLEQCSSCASELKILQESMQFMATQKKAQLSAKKTQDILSVLAGGSKTRKLIFNDTHIFISRIAAIFIIAFGLLAGIVAGGLFFSNIETETDPWVSEFSLLSDNTTYSLFE